MKSVTELIPSARLQLTVSPAPVKARELPPEAKRQTEALINRLFSQLRAIYPAWKQAWTSQALYDEAKATWTQALLDAGIADWALIEQGLARCRLEPGDFIPSAGRFIERCWPTPEQLGAPEVEAAYWEAQRNSHPAMASHATWSHPAVYHAARRLKQHVLLHLPAELGRLKFAEAYRAVIRELAMGAQLEEPAPALPAEVYRKGDPATASAALAAMRAAVGGGRV